MRPLAFQQPDIKNDHRIKYNWKFEHDKCRENIQYNRRHFGRNFVDAFGRCFLGVVSPPSFLGVPRALGLGTHAHYSIRQRLLRVDET